MRIIYTIILIYLSSTSILAQSPNWQWVKTINGPIGTFYSASKSSAIDVDGNIYTTGTFLGTVDFDPGSGVFNLSSTGNREIFVSKFDNSGNFIWAKAMGGINDDQPASLDLDSSGNVYLTGFFTGTANFNPNGTYNLTSIGSFAPFIVKLDTLGFLVWAKQFESLAGGIGTSIKVDTSGNILILGNFSGTCDFDPNAGTFNLSGVSDTYVCKLDNSGNFIWAKAFNGNGSDNSLSMAIDNSGNIYTTGLFRQTVDFDPNVGVFNLTAVGGSDIFISKLDNLGNFVWAKKFGGVVDDAGQSISISSDNNIYTTGNFNGIVDFDPNVGIFNLTSAANDIFISKLDSLGNFVYAKSIGSSGDDNSLSIVNDNVGNVYFAGYFNGTTIDFDPNAGISNSTGEGGKDLFVSKWDNIGNLLWVKATGGTNDDQSSCLILDNSNHVYLLGSFKSPSINFDPFTFTNSNPSTVNIFLAKIDNTLGNHENEIIKNEITVFPNPFSYQCRIKFENEQKNTIVKIIDILGKEVKTIKFSGQEIIIEKENMKPGIYLIKAIDEENQISITKIILQ